MSSTYAAWAKQNHTMNADQARAIVASCQAMTAPTGLDLLRLRQWCEALAGCPGSALRALSSDACPESARAGVVLFVQRKLERQLASNGLARIS